MTKRMKGVFPLFIFFLEIIQRIKREKIRISVRKIVGER
jgi:hypothetical protein